MLNFSNFMLTKLIFSNLKERKKIHTCEGDAVTDGDEEQIHHCHLPERCLQSNSAWSSCRLQLRFRSAEATLAVCR